MSDAPCKEFSAALKTAVTELMLREEPVRIPAEVMAVQKSLMARRLYDEHFNYGVMGSSSQMMRRKSDTQYEFNVNVVFPFKLIPTQDHVRPGFVMLEADCDVSHPAVVDGFLDRKAFTNWLLGIFLRKSPPSLNVRDFKRDFIVGRHLQNSVACLPVLEFDHSQWPLPSPGLSTSDLRLQAHPWYAVPQATTPLDSRTFAVWAPDWERCTMDAHQHSRRLLRLMAALGSNHASEYELDNMDHVIRTIMLQEVLNLPRDLGDAMIAFLAAVVSRLQEGRQTRYLVDNINVLQFVAANRLEMYHNYFSTALLELKNLKLSAQNEASLMGQNQSNNVADHDVGNHDGDTDTDNDDLDSHLSYSDEEIGQSWMTKLLKMFVRNE